jgi:hypothetical protein
MLATQDVQPSAGAQLAFEERSVDGAEEADELKQIFRQLDLLLLRAAGVAARFAAKPYYEEQALPVRSSGFVSNATRPARLPLT